MYCFEFFKGTLNGFSNFNGMSITFSLFVCNFSLFGEQSVRHLFKLFSHLLKDEGHLLIQTIHPHRLKLPNKEGWRESSWQGFSKAFHDPASWYYRPLSAWRNLFIAHGFDFHYIEPLDTINQAPLSLILTGKKGLLPSLQLN